MSPSIRLGMALTLLTVICGGCDEYDNVSVFVSGNVAPSDDDCFLDVENPLVSRGVFNIERAQRYVMFPLYVNQLRNRANDFRADTNGVFLQEAVVELRASDGSTLAFGGLPNPFSVPTSDFVPSGEGTSPGRAVGNVQVIPLAYRDAMLAAGAPDLIIVSMRMNGVTSGDVLIETDEWLWPIDICGGDCLFVCAGPTGQAETACLPGQDFASVVNCN